MHAVLGTAQNTKKRYLGFKKIRQCQKERFNRRKEKEETNTVLEKEWLLLMEEKYLHAEELKEERNCLYQLKQDIKNND